MSALRRAFGTAGRLLLADSGLSAHDHKAAVRHSGRNVQTLHSFSGTHFRTDFIPPQSMVASPSQNRLWADTYPALRTPAGPAPPPHGHSLAILFRFFFDPLRTRPGASQGEWRGVGAGRDRGMYQINGRRKQQQGRSGHGREGAAPAHAMSPPPRKIGMYEKN